MADQIIDIAVSEIIQDVVLNITPDIIEINVNSISNDPTKVPYTGATGNVNLGEYGLKSGYYQFDTTPTGTPTTLGTLYWDTFYRTASLIDGDGDTTLQIGQEQRTLIHNNTGATLTDGQVVYITGSTGELPTVTLANASSEGTSAATLGVVTESIAHGAAGFITDSGIVHGLNTLAFNEGDMLWLGTTAGTFTNVKPTSPNHLVLIGYVVKKAGGNGSIKVKIQNTQELDECSDVLFSGLSNNNVLTWESATSLWKNKSLSTILGYTAANDANVVHLSGTETITGLKTFSSALTASSIIKSGGTSSQFLKADGSVDSSSYALTSQLHNAVTLGTANGLSLSTQVLSLGLASTSTTGALSSTDWNTFNNKQNALTNPITGTGTTNYIPKFTGTSALGNSLIYDNGTNVGIGTISPLQKLHVNGLSYFASDIFTYANGGIFFNGNSNYTSGIYQNASGLNLQLGSTPRIFIANGGNVGIGTTTPANRLDVKGADGTTTQAIFASNSTITNGWGGIQLGNAAGNQNSQIIHNSAGDNSLNFISNYSGGTTNAFTFSPGGTERVRFLQNGNVGIGTTSPTSKLQVVGLSSYADNAAAIAGGLTVGAFYHTSGTLKVVI